MTKSNNYITSEGYKKIQTELLELIKHDRPKIVEIVSWAAGNGDRSENGDYIYGKKKLRQIDGRIRFLTKIIEASNIIHPGEKIDKTKIFFGALIELFQEKSNKTLKLRIVGQYETSHEDHYISWISPLGKALLGRKKRETIDVNIDGINTAYTIINIDY